MFDQIIKTAREFPDKDEIEVVDIARIRFERAENAPVDGWVPTSPAGVARQSLELIGWKTLDDLGAVHPVIQAARDLAAKKIGFGEFKRIVRDNS